MLLENLEDPEEDYQRHGCPFENQYELDWSEVFDVAKDKKCVENLN